MFNLKFKVMKMNYFLGAAAAFGLLAFSSCSNDGDPLSTPEIAQNGDQVIVLDMQDTDVLSTKSRPLYSTTNKGAEQVTDVQLLLFGINEQTAEYKFIKNLSAISNWNNTSDDYVYGRKKELKLTGNDRLKKDVDGVTYDKFIILAVGQDESNTTVTANPAPFKITTQGGDKYVKDLATAAWNKSTWNLSTEPGTGFLQTAAIDAKAHVGEIFSGVSTPIEFTIDGGFSTTVLLKRQVAGVMGYFNRIPAAVNGTAVTGIRLVSAVKNTALDLSIALSDQLDDATYGQPVDRRIESVVNGFTAVQKEEGVTFKNGKDAYTVYTIDLKKWFTWTKDGEDKFQAWDNSSLIEGEDNVQLLGNVEGWHNALDASNSTKVTVADGSVFAGNFVIPFENSTIKNSGNNTFELQLLAENGDVLKAWDVKLDLLSQDKVKGDSDKVYNVYRNHLYQVGKRGSGDTPTNPGVDPDKPQPLDKDQELIIKINDQWEFIHDMEIE